MLYIDISLRFTLLLFVVYNSLFPIITCELHKYLLDTVTLSSFYYLLFIY